MAVEPASDHRAHAVARRRRARRVADRPRKRTRFVRRRVSVFGSGWFKLPLVGWTFCFFFHLANGVRHLAWDAGYGFDPKRIRASGWTVVIVSFVATAAFSFAAII